VLLFGEHVVEQLAAVVGGDGGVAGADLGAVQRLEAQDVAVGVVVGEDTDVGDAEPLQMVGEQGGAVPLFGKGGPIRLSLPPADS
jgi:hypothetical protein